MAEQDLQAEVAALNLLSPNQRELVETDIATMERALHTGQAMGYGGRDMAAQAYVPGDGPISAEEHGFMGRTPPNVPEPELMRHNLVADRQTLALGSPPDYSTHRKNLLYQRYKAEVEAYREGLLSHGQMWDANIANIHHHVRHTEVNQARGKFISNMRKIFEPQEDDFSLDELRPHDPISINSAAFRRQFDHIQWSDSQELAKQVVELDLDTYYRFLELRAVTDDSSVIMTKLVIDRATYEACAARLAAAAPVSAVDEAMDEEPQGPLEYDPQVSLDETQSALERVATYVEANQGLTYGELARGHNSADLSLSRAQFAAALKDAVGAGLLRKESGRYYWATSGPEQEWTMADEPSLDDQE